jgi:hypothetical protein
VSCIFELIQSKHLICGFVGKSKGDLISPYIVRVQDLIKENSWSLSLHPIPLMDYIFPFILKTMGLFTGLDELLTQDPIKYWRTISDIKQFFSLLVFLDLQSYELPITL